MDKQHYHAFQNLVYLLALAIILAVLAWPMTTQAGNALPSRATPTPSSTNSSHKHDRDDDNDNNLVGATIELQVAPDQAGKWTVVQWQDSAGGWHDVEGWQSSLEPGGQRWWVAARDFGKGPFRWVILPNRAGQPIATSQSFKLPIMPGETTEVSVTVK